MNDILDVELILKKNKYSKMYNLGIILTVIILIFIYVINIYQYQGYYFAKGKVVNNKLELLINIDDIKYINNNNYIILDSQLYKYSINNISNELLVDESYHNYQYVYLNIDGLNQLNNYVYQVKIPQKKQKLVKYLKQYF